MMDDEEMEVERMVMDLQGGFNVEDADKKPGVGF
jgi:hypothetical protein